MRSLSISSGECSGVYVDHDDGKGWCGQDGRPVPEDTAMVVEIAYLKSEKNEDSSERAEYLSEIWWTARQLGIDALALLVTTAKTLRG
jgi:hypothetical protein